jgi:hypothetical protein
MEITVYRRIANAATGLTGIKHTAGIFKVSYTTAAGVEYSALFTLYSNAGTKTTVLTAGSGTNFSIAVDTASKVNVYFDGELKVQNNSGTDYEFYIVGQAL